MDADTQLAPLVSVLSERWVFALATFDPETPEIPYPTPLYFALVDTRDLGGPPGPALVFVSDPSTRHGRQLGRGPTAAAGAVFLESEAVGELRGAQLRGRVWREDGLEAAGVADARRRLSGPYLARHPVAADMLAREGSGPRLFALVVGWAKVTDNRVGFGRHPEWGSASPWPAPPAPSPT